MHEEELICLNSCSNVIIQSGSGGDDEINVRGLTLTCKQRYDQDSTVT